MSDPVPSRPAERERLEKLAEIEYAYGAMPGHSRHLGYAAAFAVLEWMQREGYAKPSLPPDGERICQACGERREDVAPTCATCRELAMKANAALFTAAPEAEKR